MIRFFVLFFTIITLLPAEPVKHIVFVAGRHSNTHGEHEFSAGAFLLADQINQAGLPVKASVIDGYWPEDEKELLEADALVIYSDGLGNHVMNTSFDVVDMWIKDGRGVGFLHTSSQVIKGHKARKMTEWTGGYYEKYYSTDPEWECQSILSKNHEICNGVKPFSHRDKWLFNLRFDQKKKIIPLLKGVPGELARSGKHTSHGSPIESVVENAGKEETLMWAYEGEKQGRSFVFTGGHYHDTWSNANIRRLVMNAAVWLTGLSVPDKGVKTTKLSEIDKRKNMSEDRSEFIWQEERRILSESNLKFSSKVITDKTPGKSVMIDLDIQGAKELILLVLDGGNGISRDHAVWAYPVLTDIENEQQVSLTDLKWEQALTGWRSIKIDKGLNGLDLKLNGREVKGIATHSISVIRYKIPEGMTRFQTTAGQADSRDGGSIQFQVYVR